MIAPHPHECMSNWGAGGAGNETPCITHVRLVQDGEEIEESGKNNRMYTHYCTKYASGDERGIMSRFYSDK